MLFNLGPPTATATPSLQLRPCPFQATFTNLSSSTNLLFWPLDPGLPRLRLIYAFPISLMSLYSNLLLCTFCVCLKSSWRHWSARELHRMRRRLNGPVILQTRIRGSHLLHPRVPEPVSELRQ